MRSLCGYVYVKLIVSKWLFKLIYLLGDEMFLFTFRSDLFIVHLTLRNLVYAYWSQVSTSRNIIVDRLIITLISIWIRVEMRVWGFWGYVGRTLFWSMYVTRNTRWSEEIWKWAGNAINLFGKALVCNDRYLKSVLSIAIMRLFKLSLFFIHK